MRRLKQGDKIIGKYAFNKDIIKEILEVRETGYTWKYVDYDMLFISENSTDPLFELGWELIKP